MRLNLLVTLVVAPFFASWKVKMLPFIYHIRQVRLKNIRFIFHICLLYYYL
jgi:hypothetical protein